MRLRALACLATLALSGCVSGERVTRIAGGFRSEGRYIRPESYSAFTGGVIAEAQGNLANARAYYEAALEYDADSPEILSRLGAVSCKLALEGDRSQLRVATRAFEEALEVDPSFAPAYYERALCSRAQGERERALADALSAVRFDPSPASFSELVSELLFEGGRASEAWAWLDALAVRSPDSAEVWSVYRRAAERQNDAIRLRRALRNQVRLGSPEPRPEAADTETIDALLSVGDLPAARLVAKARRWTNAELALRAVEIGALEAGYEQAIITLRADPGDADAWVAALTAADEARDEERFEAVLRALDARPIAPSPRALALLEELLSRRVGAEAARALREGWQPSRHRE